MKTKPRPSDRIATEEQASPLERVAEELHQWRKHGHWWEPESEDWLDRLTVPADTREGWERSFGELASLVFGGLHVEAMRSALTEEGVPFDPSEEPLRLLQKIVEAREADGCVERLAGLATLLASRLGARQVQAPDAVTHTSEALCIQIEKEMRAVFRSLDHRYRYLASKYG